MQSINSQEDCHKYLKLIGKEFYINGLGCNGTFDSLLCWEATSANTTLKQKCPEITSLFDSTKFVYKYCSSNGHWAYPDSIDGFNETTSSGGKTDYLKYCLSDSAMEFRDYLSEKLSTILGINRYVELTGLCLSLVCICISLFIFLYFKVLRCNRTRIHVNLFFAILMQIVVRLIIYVDQLAVNSGSVDIKDVSAIGKNTQGLCQTIHILLQYSLSSMFMWMLIEGVYLNVLLMYTVFDENEFKIMIWFYIFGWGLPVFLVLSWAIVMIIKIEMNEFCWIGYEKMNYYWILQGPRFIIIAINVLCLFNVIRILVTKLRENKTTETQQIRKSLRAAVLLLPLLGITNVVNFVDPPKTVVLHTIVTISTTFLLMYQGVFVSALYCFLNNEVKNVIYRFWINRKDNLQKPIFKAKPSYPLIHINTDEKIESEKFIDPQKTNNLC